MFLDRIVTPCRGHEYVTVTRIRASALPWRSRMPFISTTCPQNDAVHRKSVRFCFAVVFVGSPQTNAAWSVRSPPHGGTNLHHCRPCTSRTRSNASRTAPVTVNPLGVLFAAFIPYQRRAKCSPRGGIWVPPMFCVGYIGTSTFAWVRSRCCGIRPVWGGDSRLAPIRVTVIRARAQYPRPVTTTTRIVISGGRRTLLSTVARLSMPPPTAIINMMLYTRSNSVIIII